MVQDAKNDYLAVFVPKLFLFRLIEQLSVVFNNTIGGIMEILSQILLILLMDRVWCGRKRLLIGECVTLSSSWKYLT